MTSTISRSSLEASRSKRRRRPAPPLAERAAGHDHPRRRTVEPHERSPLGRYTDSSGRAREVVARTGIAGSVLVVDRDAETLADRRLVAHLADDEPAENAAVTCGCFLEQARRGEGGCRRLLPDDFHSAPFADDPEAHLSTDTPPADAALVDRAGRSYRLERVPTGMSIPELRWQRRSPLAHPGEPCSVSVREVIAALEGYEPVRMLTRRALALGDVDHTVSIAVLRAELARMLESPIVLNRGLREETRAAVERQGLSMSEIAMRCGRIKRDRAGNESGETSWLARRLGILPEGGRDAPTPWIHSDVLALIARRGLGLSPREAELE